MSDYWPTQRHAVLYRLRNVLYSFNAKHGTKLRAVKANDKQRWQIRLELNSDESVPLTPWLPTGEVRAWLRGFDLADRLAGRKPEDYGDPPDPKELTG